MKELLLNNMEMIISIISFLTTYILGLIAKKTNYLQSKIIPIQNLLIMTISVLFFYFVSGDISLVIASGSPVATLIYDTMHCLTKEE